MHDNSDNYRQPPFAESDEAPEKTANLTVLDNVQDIDRAIIKLIGRRCHYIAMLRRHRGQRDAVADTNTERALRLAFMVA